MKPIFLTLTCSLALGTVCLAQRHGPSVIATAGGSAQTKTLDLDWTLGEPVVTTAHTADRLYTQGFHQPMLRIEEMATRVNLGGTDAAYQISVAPNPVVSVLTVAITAPDEKPLALSLLDLNGHQHLTQTLTGGTSSSQVDMAHLPTGTYLLRINQSAGEPVKTYKIIKQ